MGRKRIVSLPVPPATIATSPARGSTPVFAERRGESALEHAASADCWRGPTIDYVDPESGATVYVHHEPN